MLNVKSMPLVGPFGRWARRTATRLTGDPGQVGHLEDLAAGLPREAQLTRDAVAHEGQKTREYVAGLLAENGVRPARLSELELENAELRRRVEEQNQQLGRINLNLFRFELKTEDERRFHHSSGDLEVEVTPHQQYPFTHVRARHGGREFNEPLYYGHLALAKLVTEYDFHTVLDVGAANGTAAKLFKFLGKDTSTIEIQPGFESKYSGDYLDIQFPEPFDCIWISHVLEHQRYLGRFLEKLYADLKVGGILALSVPAALSVLMVGHCNVFTPLHMIYNLVLAGFDCREARSKTYDWQFSVIVKKTPNGIPPLSFAAVNARTLGDTEIGCVTDLSNYFPVPVPPNGHVWGEIDSINW